MRRSCWGDNFEDHQNLTLHAIQVAEVRQKLWELKHPSLQKKAKDANEEEVDLDRRIAKWLVDAGTTRRNVYLDLLHPDDSVPPKAGSREARVQEMDDALQKLEDIPSNAEKRAKLQEEIKALTDVPKGEEKAGAADVRYGGKCTCPDGLVYQVAAPGNDCDKLGDACVGGETGTTAT